MRRFPLVISTAVLVLCLAPTTGHAAGVGGRVTSRVAPADIPIPPPVASGQLAVVGTLRDGETVAAVGLRWSPAASPTAIGC